MMSTPTSPSPDATPPVGPVYAPGDVLGDRYRLIERIAEGGMGAVWRAEGLSLGWDVAIKLLHGELRSPDSAARFAREAKAAVVLEHPSIVRVFDFGETRYGEPYLVMELIRGESLADLMDLRGRFTETAAVQMMLPIADALVAAHGRGIVHRDLKPGNIVMSTQGDDGARLPKLVDFGLAIRTNSAIRDRITLAGEIIGSPGYMAPEQSVSGLEIGAAADIWAFSVVLYEMVTGIGPFARANEHASIAAVLHEEPKPTTDLLPETDGDLWRIIRRGLQKEPKERWASMADMRAELIEWALDHGATIDVTGAPLVSRKPSERPRPMPPFVPPSPPAPDVEPDEPPISPPPMSARSGWDPHRRARPVPKRSSHQGVAAITMLAAVITVLVAAYAVAHSISDGKGAEGPPGAPPRAPAR
ncbi:MAG: serine/threonine-protein kinase [Byssovorax sp.]